MQAHALLLHTTCTISEEEMIRAQQGQRDREVVTGLMYSQMCYYWRVATAGADQCDAGSVYIDSNHTEQFISVAKLGVLYGNCVKHGAIPVTLIYRSLDCCCTLYLAC